MTKNKVEAAVKEYRRRETLMVGRCIDIILEVYGDALRQLGEMPRSEDKADIGQIGRNEDKAE